MIGVGLSYFANGAGAGGVVTPVGPVVPATPHMMYDFSDTSKMTLSGSTITSVDAQAQADQQVTIAPDAGQEPVFNASGAGGKGIAEFSTGGIYAKPLNGIDLPDNVPLTFLVVANVVNITDYAIMFCLGKQGDADRFTMFYKYSNGRIATERVYRLSAPSRTESHPSAINALTTGLHAFVVQISTTETSVWIDGVKVVDSVPDSDNFIREHDMISIGEGRSGANGSYQAAPWDDGICEVVLYDSTVAESDLTAYAVAKWGTPSPPA